MTGAASPCNQPDVQIIVKPANAFDCDRLGIEQLLASKYACATGELVRFLALRSPLEPGIEEVEDHWREGGSGGVAAQRVVDADKERRHCVKRNEFRAAFGPVGIQ